MSCKSLHEGANLKSSYIQMMARKVAVNRAQDRKHNVVHLLVMKSIHVNRSSVSQPWSSFECSCKFVHALGVFCRNVSVRENRITKRMMSGTMMDDIADHNVQPVSTNQSNML